MKQPVTLKIEIEVDETKFSGTYYLEGEIDDAADFYQRYILMQPLKDTLNKLKLKERQQESTPESTKPDMSWYPK